jgi:hypothetical protein
MQAVTPVRQAQDDGPSNAVVPTLMILALRQWGISSQLQVGVPVMELLLQLPG